MKTTTPATTKALLTAGTVAGPLFLTTWLVQVLIYPSPDGLSLRLVAASAILYAFVAAVAAHARARVASPDSPAAPFERNAR